MSDESQLKLHTLFEVIGKKLTMKRFDDRLEVQKILYLAQAYGIDFGYHYSWYLRGPYSKDVADDGFAIESSNNTTTVMAMHDKKTQEFKNIITPHMDDPIWLEIAASVIYLKEKQYKKKPLDHIIGCLVGDMTCGYKNFDEASVKSVMKEIVKNGLLK